MATKKRTRTKPKTAGQLKALILDNLDELVNLTKGKMWTSKGITLSTGVSTFIQIGSIHIKDGSEEQDPEEEVTELIATGSRDD